MGSCGYNVKILITKARWYSEFQASESWVFSAHIYAHLGTITSIEDQWSPSSVLFLMNQWHQWVGDLDAWDHSPGFSRSDPLGWDVVRITPLGWGGWGSWAWDRFAQKIPQKTWILTLQCSFEVVEKNLKWRIHYHSDVAELGSALEQAEHPPYFFCIKDRHMLPTEVLKAVALQGGYFYEGLPSDPEKLLKHWRPSFILPLRNQWKFSHQPLINHESLATCEFPMIYWTSDFRQLP